MAKSKSLKHLIKLICGELFAEAVAASLYGNDPHNTNAEGVIFSIIRLQKNYICRVSHIEPGMKAKEYFRDLREKFSADIDEIVDQINNLWAQDSP